MDKAPTNDNNAPIIFIVGSTGSGKTKLSLSLAQHIKDIEIVGADALQLYKTADIMTAKATAEERATVKHHVIDILDLECLDFGRKDYFEIASKKIKELHEEKKIPLVVGGTNYYIESLLYSDFDMTGTHETDDPEIDDLYAQVRKKVKGDSENKEEAKTIIDVEIEKKDFENWEQLPLSEKHELLTKIDPLIAEKVHPNDTKRVENYIKVYLEEGVVPSKKIMRVNSQRKLRYSNPVIFWVKDKEKENLAERIKKRIYEMVSMEGIREILQIYEYLEGKGPFEFQRGVLQSIGYKEFYEFYKRIKDVMKEKEINNVADFLKDKASKEDFDEETKEVLGKCIKQLIGATDQYAKRQIRWVKNRIASESLLAGKFFLLEFSESAKFEEEVVRKALDIMKDYREGKLDNGKEEDGKEGNNDDQDQIQIKYENWKRYFCEICDVTASGQEQWEIHTKSKKHKKMKEGQLKHKRNMEMKMKYEQNKAQENKEEVPE